MLIQNVGVPVSMLPDENIFCWRHYAGMFDVIFPNLEALGSEGQHLIALKDQAFNVVKKTMWMAGGLAIGIARIESMVI